MNPNLRSDLSDGFFLTLYDTTLRDGTQAEEISFTVEDKLRVAEALDALGVHYIEAGWPGSNPRDLEFFERGTALNLKKARIVAFGATRKAGKKAAEDPNLNALLASKAPVITIFGKTWDFHVEKALKISCSENLDLIADSIAYLKSNVEEVIYDAEHFFDGYKSNPDYALKTLKAAQQAGASWIVLCDTNGGTLPWEISAITEKIVQSIAVPIGIHCHNDGELAVANSLAAVRAGARQVHGTINGIGERCGNANLISVIANLNLKMGFSVLSAEQLRKLTEVSHLIDELANRKPQTHQAFVGRSAFAHKGGIHVSAVLKDAKTYEHIDPEQVGNQRRVLVSDLSGASNILYKATELGISLSASHPLIPSILKQLKDLENEGFQFEGAEASFELLLKKALGEYRSFFKLIGFRVLDAQNAVESVLISEATVKIEVEGQTAHTAAEGQGPVHALDLALRKALEDFYPELKQMHLIDFKVRVLQSDRGTQSRVRVLIESSDEKRKWGTVGVSDNVIQASWMALVDSIEYKLLKDRE